MVDIIAVLSVCRHRSKSDNEYHRASNRGNLKRSNQHHQQNDADDSDTYSTTSSRLSTSSNAAAFDLMASAFRQRTVKLVASIAAAANRVIVGTNFNTQCRPAVSQQRPSSLQPEFSA